MLQGFLFADFSQLPVTVTEYFSVVHCLLLAGLKNWLLIVD